MSPAADGGPDPRHIAFIMDGNGRWARSRGLRRLRGHEQGAESLRRITRYCRRLGIPEVTFYALSAENYRRRPRLEVGFLMRLLERFLVSEREELTTNDIRLAVIGDVHELPESVQATLRETLRLTAGGGGMVMRLALNYGSRQEIIRAAQAIAREAREGRLDAASIEALDETTFRRHLGDPEMRDPDLVVRTAGEFRLSNFLLWQASYAEWWISPKLWPDFDVPDLEEALRSFAGRERKFGTVGRHGDEREEAAGGDAATRPSPQVDTESSTA